MLTRVQHSQLGGPEWFLSMNWRGSFTIILWLVASAVSASTGVADDDKAGPFFALTEENDLFSDPLLSRHTDRHYTQGAKLTYCEGDDDLPQWTAQASEAFPPLWINTSAQNVGCVFGQNLYTPQNLHTNALIKTDRPYAGLLYGGMFLQRRGVVTEAQIPVMESFEVDLGFTGRPSLAQAAQENYHRWFVRGDIPRGWHNQLATEPTLTLKYERLWRLTFDKTSAHYVDFIPHLGAEVGNVEIFGSVGGTARLGVNLPDDFGVPIIDSLASLRGGTTPHAPAFSCYAFAGVDTRAVGQNLFLDGNTLRNSPSVERIPWVADLAAGFAVRLFRHLEVSYTRVVRTHEFVGQHHLDKFGSLTAKTMFLF